MASDSGDVLEEGGADLPALELGSERARHVEEREDGGLGEETGERDENSLAASHPGQPVVDEGDPQLTASAWAGTGRPSAVM